MSYIGQLKGLYLKLDSPVIKTLERIRFSSNQNIGEGESNFDDKYVEKSVQLVRGSSFRNDLLQNPYFNIHKTNYLTLGQKHCPNCLEYKCWSNL